MASGAYTHTYTRTHTHTHAHAHTHTFADESDYKKPSVCGWHGPGLKIEKEVRIDFTVLHYVRNKLVECQ